MPAGLLAADGARAFPRARVVAQAAEWESALGTNPRLQASYDQAELRLVEPWAHGPPPPTARRRSCQACRSSGPAGIRAATRRSSCAAPSGTVGFIGDLFMRPWGANPRWISAFDDYPLTSVAVKAELFRQAADEAWTIVLSHEPRKPVGRLVADRDRFRFEPLV